ncbi:MAG: ATP-binding protein [Actinomycetota bacterium]|nr:ATP-binding protein [Actinomycetota bacterium]
MTEHSNRWLELFLVTRLAAATVAAILLLVTDTPNTGLLVSACLGYAAVSCLAFSRLPALQYAPAAWMVDAVAGFALIMVAGNWRSPFYLFAITSLILPATSLGFRKAVAWGGAFSLTYFVVGLFTTLEPNTLESAVSLETVTTRVLTPLMVTLALAYAQRLLNRLDEERERSERLAVQTERQRIAWELHDSAKQRLHAAHLVLTMVRDRIQDADRALLDQALGELGKATGDMQTSVAELHTPIDGRPLGEIVAQRALELGAVTRADIRVEGRAPTLPPLVAAHATRIAGEALTNAVRHAGAQRIKVELGGSRQLLRITVRDDGRGLPEELRPGSNGLRSMRERAATIGGTLEVEHADGGGTVVALEVPLNAVPQEVS